MTLQSVFDAERRSIEENLERQRGALEALGGPLLQAAELLRASLAASILKRAGFNEVYNVLGGITAWKAKDYPLLYERLLEK